MLGSAVAQLAAPGQQGLLSAGVAAQGHPHPNRKDEQAMSTSPSQTLSQAAKASLPLSRSGSAPLRSSLRRVVARRPAMAWSLAMLFAFKAFVCLAAILFPVSSSEPVGLIAAAGALGGVGACLVWLAARGISPPRFY